MENDIRLSIITPSYNRGNLLIKCFESLKKQSIKSFQWIIVDDGSIDNTEDIVKGFEADFEIEYVKKNNGGKHTALNVSHGYIKGDYVLILDSDDYLIDSAVDDVLLGWEKYKEDESIAIVTFLKGASVSEPSCMAYPEDEGKPVDIMCYRRKYIRSSDACEVIRSSVFKKYPFPVFEGERFISECALWDRVSFSYSCVYINKVIYIAEYLEGGLSDLGKPLRIGNPHGGMFTANLRMNSKNYSKERIKNGLLYTCYGFFAGKRIKDMASECDSKMLMYLCLPFGYALYIYWKNKYVK